MKRILIIHFNPLELYPPVQNILHELGKVLTRERVIVISAKNSRTGLTTFQTDCPRIKILRPVSSDQSKVNVRRYIDYLVFYILCLITLIRYLPRTLLYFETISSLPAYLYKRFMNRKAEVFIHYHEYTSPAEYSSGMTLVKWFHKFERWLYPRAKWVSHTNDHRMERFKRDIAPVLVHRSLILPNYPPKSWRRQQRGGSKTPLKIVYAGALSLDTMYTREFADWVLRQNGRAVWDIYSYNCTDEARNYIESLRSSDVNLKPGVDYNNLPTLFENYDVGVILYNGHIPNYIFNAPNKLFEYWACGLSVWFPNVMVGSLHYCTKDTSPAVVAVDFNSLDDLRLEQLSSCPVSIRESNYFCEDALREITYELLT